MRVTFILGSAANARRGRARATAAVAATDCRNWRRCIEKPPIPPNILPSAGCRPEADNEIYRRYASFAPREPIILRSRLGDRRMIEHGAEAAFTGAWESRRAGRDRRGRWR